jgi:hypothetical protein
VEPEADARNRRREVGELTAVQWNRLDPARADDAADRRRGRLDERRRAGHGDGLGNRGDLEVEVDRDRLADVDFDVLLRHGREAGEFGNDFVGADRQGGHAIHAFRIARFGARQAGGGVLGGNRRAGDGRALWINDTAGDVPSRLLRERRGAREQQQQSRAEQ